MRTEKEVYDLILGVAKADERVRAAYMNGSRTNPNVTKDQYQDYDIVYVVTDTESFLKDKSWISVFGELAMLQEPDLNDIGLGMEMDFTRSYTWLMLFKDGNRIDLGIVTIEKMLEDYQNDSLTVPMLDKDGILPQIPPASDKDYWVKKPTAAKYNSCCNEFWWCQNNVVKGIARDELSYAMWMFNNVREMLHKMLDWYIGVKHDFNISPGKLGKFYKRLLPTDMYSLYEKTYSDSNYDSFWTSMFTAGELFRQTAVYVAEHFGYSYCHEDDRNMTDYLYKVKSGEL
jgi:aminoglycoside 6-adenylyltransferase